MSTVAARTPRTATAVSAIPRASRPRRLGAWRQRAVPVVGALLFVGAWEWTGRAGTFGRMWIPLTDMFDEFSVPGRTELIERAAKATFSRAALGLCVGFVLAVALAAIAAMVPRIRSAVAGAAVAINSVPWVALGPLLMIVVSRDRAPAVIAGLAVFFPSFVAATAGFVASTHHQEDLCSALGATGWRRFRIVRLPNALPALVLGLKLAVPASIIGAVFGEWFGADRGLGLLLLTSMQQSRPTLLWTVGMLTAVTTMIAYALLTATERWVTRRFALDTAEVGAVRTAGGRPLRTVLAWAAVVVAAVVAWHAYVAISDVSKFLVPSPARVGRNLLKDPADFAWNAWITIRMGVIGLALGVTTGALLAMAAWWSNLLRGLLTPMVLVARSVPTLALLPVVAGILGYNDRSIIAIGLLISFFPSFVYTSKGLREAPDGANDLMAALGASRRRIFLTVALPSSLRELAVAMRMTAGVCVIAAVVAEFMIGRRGLGRMFANAMGRQDIDRAWAVALVIVALSMVAFAAANRLERALTSRLS
jgi:sulfonate transport system permease protein